MENVALDHTTFLQLDPDGADRTLDAAAHCDVLRNDAALDLCAIADYKIRGAQLAFDSAEALRWTIAFDVADDRHPGADARACRRIRRRLPPRRGLFNDRVLLLHGCPRDFGHICRHVLFLLGYFTLEHLHPPFFRRDSLRKGESCPLAIAAAPLAFAPPAWQGRRHGLANPLHSSASRLRTVVFSRQY